MPSYRISLTPKERAGTRFVARVRRAIQKAYVEVQQESNITQSDIARALDVHRSVISRQLHGREDISVKRVGEFAWALGREISFDLVGPEEADYGNVAPLKPGRVTTSSTPTSSGEAEGLVDVKRQFHSTAVIQ